MFGQKPQLENNIRAHNRIAKQYERNHGEIYNDVEQRRLKESLGAAIKFINTGNKQIKALDFGCGAGNLTQHLSSLGCNVSAGDVSQKFLDIVSSRGYDTQVQAVLLNGVDLANIEDGSLDMVATYSVLHHVPNYLAIVSEFIRVLKKGGVIYIDHEASEEFWNKTPTHLRFLSEMRKREKREYGKYLVPSNYVNRLIRWFLNPRYQPEGDIHVWKDDHVEWKKVCGLIVSSGGEIVSEEDYLLFRRNYEGMVYKKYKDKISDMHLLVARKIVA